MFSGLTLSVFGNTKAKRQIVKRSLQILSAVGFVLICVDFGFRGSPRQLVTPAAAAHRGSMALGWIVMRYHASEAKASRHWKALIPLDIRSVCEVITFALSFISFYEGLGLGQRVNYKLVRRQTSALLFHLWTNFAGIKRIIHCNWNYTRCYTIEAALQGQGGC